MSSQRSPGQCPSVLAEHALGKLVGVRAPVLPRADVDVAHHAPPHARAASSRPTRACRTCRDRRSRAVTCRSRLPSYWIWYDSRSSESSARPKRKRRPARHRARSGRPPWIRHRTRTATRPAPPPRSRERGPGHPSKSVVREALLLLLPPLALAACSSAPPYSTTVGILSRARRSRCASTQATLERLSTRTGQPVISSRSPRPRWRRPRRLRPRVCASRRVASS